MSVHEIQFEADRCLKLQQEVAGLRIALDDKENANSALRRELRLVRTQYEALRLSAEEHLEAIKRIAREMVA